MGSTGERILDVNIEVWVQEYSDLLFGYASSRVQDHETARDLLQETFLSAWRNRDNYRGEVSVKNWLFTILRSRIIDHYRKVSTQKVDGHWSGPDDFFDDEEHWKEGHHPREIVVDPREQMEMADLGKIVKACGSKLKASQYAVFTMKYVDGMESDEICRLVGISPSNFWVLVHRAKLQLRACLEKNWLKQ